jgi:hypothetical protein
MSSESVCQVARSWVEVGSFHTRLVMRFMIFTASVRNILETPSYIGEVIITPRGLIWCGVGQLEFHLTLRLSILLSTVSWRYMREREFIASHIFNLAIRRSSVVKFML